MRRERSAAILVAALRTAFCFYRASRQSITVDEAMGFERFIQGPWSSIYSRYDASNHVLYSILAKLSTHLFGVSELSLRLPSLIAGFFLCLAIFRLLRQTTASPAIRWVAFIALLLHPLLLDFSVAARGYALGLAFLIMAISFVIEPRYVLCGVMVGLALSSNLTNAFPAAGLAFAILIVEKRRFRALSLVTAPAASVFLAICYRSLRSAKRDSFYFGYDKLSDSISNLLADSFRVTPHAGLFGADRAILIFMYVVLPLVIVFIVAASLRIADRRRLIPLLTLGGAVIAVVVARYASHLSYPANRTGLYLIVLFGIAWAIAAAQVASMPMRAVQVALGSLIAIQFATQLHTGYFSVWQFDSDTKNVAREIQRMTVAKPADSVSAYVTWWNQPALEFYRGLFHITALRPIERIERIEYSHDFFLFSGGDFRTFDRSKIRVVFNDREAGVVLGVPASP